MEPHVAAIVDPTIKRRTVKKSVSFQAHATGDAGSTKEKPDLPSSSRTILLVQSHLPIVLYSLFKSGLTVDPYMSMVKGLISLLMMQIMYGILLASYEKKCVREGKTKSKKTNEINRFWLVLSSILVSVVLANVVFIALILFGAPLHGFLRETYLLACHMSVIVFAPLLILFRFDVKSFGEIFTGEHFYRIIFNDQILCSSSGALIGAWLGVIPIPLDWDRPWQQWPITILTGGYVGAFVGSLFSLFLR